MLAKFLQKILRIKWVAFYSEGNHRPELWLSVCGVIFALYKGDVYIPKAVECRRRPLKREFGESLRPEV